MPPLLGLKFIVPPIHKFADGVLTTGNAFIVTLDVVLLQLVVPSVKVNVTLPDVTPVTTPVAGTTDATPGLLLTHVPPLLGLRFSVPPIHKLADGVLTTGNAFTVTLVVVLLQLVAASVKVNVTLPALTPVTTPVAGTTDATPGLLLTHVPPLLGLRFSVPPIHKLADGALTTGNAFTVTLVVVLLQLVAASVKVNVTLPALTPVTTPVAGTTDATLVGSLLTHVPPLLGLRFSVPPIHKLADGVLTTGNAFIVTLDVVLLQLVVPSVKVNVTLPALTPVTTPVAGTTDATPGLLLTHVPPLLGLRFSVPPIHKLADGVLTTGNAFTVTLVVVLLQLVAASVKVNVTLPDAIPATTPALVTVALVGSLLTQVPPEVGDKVSVLPIHKLADGVLTTGNAFIVTLDVVLLQLVVPSVKVNVTLPDAIPATTPALVTVALVGSLLTQVPPDVGDKVSVLPIHKLADGALTTGNEFTVTLDVVLLQLVVPSVKVNVTLPDAIPATTPALVTVALVGSLLTQVPPDVGDKVSVLPIHKLADGVLTTGNAFIVTLDVVLLQLVVPSVKVNVTLPDAIPATTPALVTVALVGSLLTQVPPEVGDKVSVLPIHKLDDGALTTGNEFIVTADVVLLQVVAVLVKVNVTLPDAIPATTPALVTVALVGSLLTQVPPEIGDKVSVLPIHKLDDGVLTTGNAFIVTLDVVLLQLVVPSVKVNVTLPDAIPATTPALVTVALVGSLLTQVPPEVGDKVSVLPIHKLADGVLTTGNAFIVTLDVVLLQLVTASVKVNVTLPDAIPITRPALVTVALVGSLLTQVPPDIGDKVIVLPIHKLADGVLTTGNAFIVTADVVLLQVVAVLVKVNVTLPDAIPATTPALVTVALVGSLLTQVPPEVGDKVSVLPIHKLADGVLTTGNAFIVTADVVLLQVVAASVKVNVTLPDAIPVTTPALVTVALVGLLLTQVPPDVGDKVSVLPYTQTR